MLLVPWNASKDNNSAPWEKAYCANEEAIPNEELVTMHSHLEPFLLETMEKPQPILWKDEGRNPWIRQINP
jgi:hypothetical protein